MSLRDWSSPRIATAVAATLSAAVLAGLTYIFALGRYLEDYCFTRTQSGATAPPGVEGPSAEGVRFAGPLTLRCEYDLGPAREVTDVWPAVGFVVLLLLVILGTCFVCARWARTPALHQKGVGAGRESVWH